MGEAERTRIHSGTELARRDSPTSRESWEISGVLACRDVGQGRHQETGTRGFSG